MALNFKLLDQTCCGALSNPRAHPDSSSGGLIAPLALRPWLWSTEALADHVQSLSAIGPSRLDKLFCSSKIEHALLRLLISCHNCYSNCS